MATLDYYTIREHIPAPIVLPNTEPLHSIMQQIEKTGEFRILQSSLMEHGWAVDINLHDPVTPGPHIKYPHYHDFFELIYVYKGEMHTIVNQKEDILLNPKQLLLMNPDTRHVLNCNDSNAVIYNIMIQQDFVEKQLLNIIDKDYTIFHFFFHSTYHDEMIKNYLVFPIDPEMEQYIHALILEHFDRKPFYKQMVVANLILVLGQIARIHKNQVTEQNHQLIQSGKLPEILQYIQLNYATVNLASMAEQFHYSEAHLSRMIKKQTGKTFSEILSDIRFQIAENYLCQSDLGVETIAEMVGYQNVSNFFRNFKQKYHCSPKEYRSQHRASR